MKRNKFASRRFWLTVWAACLCTAIVLLGLADFSGLAAILAGIVGGFIGAESYLKKTLDRSADVGKTMNIPESPDSSVIR